MNHLLGLFTAATAAALLTSCGTTYEVGGNPSALKSRPTASVEVRTDYSGDSGIRRAIVEELRQRGYSLTEKRKSSPSHVAVVFGDTWRWDFVPYILRMEL